MYIEKSTTRFKTKGKQIENNEGVMLRLKTTVCIFIYSLKYVIDKKRVGLIKKKEPIMASVLIKSYQDNVLKFRIIFFKVIH